MNNLDVTSISGGDFLSEWSKVVSLSQETTIQENSKSTPYKVNTLALIQFLILQNEDVQPSDGIGYLAALGSEYIDDPNFQQLFLKATATGAAQMQQSAISAANSNSATAAASGGGAALQEQTGLLVPTNLPVGEQERWKNVIVGLQRIHMTFNGAAYVTKHSPELLRSATTVASGFAGALTLNPIGFGFAICQLAAGFSGLRTLWKEWYGDEKSAEHFLETMKTGTDSLLTFNKISKEVIESLSKETKDLQQCSTHLEALRCSIMEGVEECAEDVKELLHETLKDIDAVQKNLHEAGRVITKAEKEEEIFSVNVERMYDGLVRIKSELEERTEGVIPLEKIEAVLQQIEGYEKCIKDFLNQASDREENREKIRKFLAEANQQQIKMTGAIVEGVKKFSRALEGVESRLEVQGEEIEKLNDTILKLRVKQMELLFLNRCEKTVLNLMQKKIKEEKKGELQELLKEYGVSPEVLIGLTAGALIPGGLLIKALSAGMINRLLAAPKASPPVKTVVSNPTTPFEVRFEFGASQGVGRVVNAITSASIGLRNMVRSLDVKSYMPERIASATSALDSYLPSLPEEASPAPLSRTQGSLILRLGDQQMSLPINFNIENNLTLGAVQTIEAFAQECLHAQKCSAMELLTFLQEVTYLKIDRRDKKAVERLIPSDYVVLFAPLLLELRKSLQQINQMIGSLPETQVSKLMIVDSPKTSPVGEEKESSSPSQNRNSPTN